MLLNMCWPNPTHASKHTKCIWTCFDYINDANEDTKCIWTCIEQTNSISARTQNVSQHVLTKQIPCQRGRKMNLNMSWSNPSHTNQAKQCISTCTPSMPAKTQNVSQFQTHYMPARTKNVLTKYIQCKRGHKMFVNICWVNKIYLHFYWPNPSLDSEGTKFITTHNIKCNSRYVY